MKRFIVFLSVLFISLAGFAQQDKAGKEADSLYKRKEYKAAAERYLAASTNVPLYVNPKGWVYNAACCYALLNDEANAIKYLDQAIYTYHYKNYDGVLADKDFTSLHNTAYWKKLKQYIDKEKKKLGDALNKNIFMKNKQQFSSTMI